MPGAKKIHPKEKASLHPRNKHRDRYDFELLISACDELKTYVKPNEYGDDSIDFFNPQAVKTLNKALLKQYYGINHWDIPANYLCPPIPGRADYIHYLADLVGNKKSINGLDIGTGSNCIYPIIGSVEYGWRFVGSDIDKTALVSAQKIIDSNGILNDKIELRLQANTQDIFKGIIKAGERFDITLCNPPFHVSQAEAMAGTARKLQHLKQKKINKPTLNFGGQSHELWCEGGEQQFIQNMMLQSVDFASQCVWFTTLVSKGSNLKAAYKKLKELHAKKIKTIDMAQGNKTTRILAWSFMA